MRAMYEYGGFSGKLFMHEFFLISTISWLCNFSHELKLGKLCKYIKKKFLFVQKTKNFLHIIPMKDFF